ncbi:MAG: prealbumin-like fold domain-containing protein, partial [Clostridiales bacterium]|nr:prealbumin-like fold domain-containing protein [Clostridiales bacterium]
MMMVFSMAAPAFAADREDPAWSQLRTMVAGTVDPLTNLAGYLTDGVLGDAISGTIKGMIDPSAIAGMAGPMIGDLLAGALGNDLPIDLAGIINDVLASDIVSGILGSDFVADVIEKVIDELFAAIDLGDALNTLKPGIIDGITDYIYDQNPNRVWDSSWGTRLYVSGATMAQLFNLGDYIGADSAGIMALLPGVDVILSIVKDAVVDTVSEYFAVYKAELIDRVRAAVDGKLADLKAIARAELIDELNKIFAYKTDLHNAISGDLECLEAQLLACIGEAQGYIEANSAKILRDLQAFRSAAAKLDKYSCLDMSKVLCIIDKLIDCLDNGGELDGAFFFTKTVEGGAFSAWLDKYIEELGFEDVFDAIDAISEVLKGMSFALYAADGTFIAEADIDANGIVSAEIDINGEVYFKIKLVEWLENNELIPGDYYIVETLTGKAADIFENEDGVVIFYFTIENNAPVAPFAVNEPNAYGFLNENGVRNPFLYKTVIVETTLTDEGIGSRNKVGENMTRQRITDAEGTVFDAFCGDYIITAYIGGGITKEYTAAPNHGGLTQAQVNKLVAILNYVEGLYEDGFEDDDAYALAQMMIWVVIHDESHWTNTTEGWMYNNGAWTEILINTEIAQFLPTTDGDYTRVKDELIAIANGFIADPSEILEAKGRYVDIVWLSNADYQPIFVPVIGEELSFDNTLKEVGEFVGTFSIQKTVEGIEFREWYLKNADKYDLAELVTGISFKLFDAKNDKFVADGVFEGGGGLIAFVFDDPAYVTLDEKLIPGEYYIIEYLEGLAAKVFKNVDGEVILYFEVGANGKAKVGADGAGVIAQPFDSSLTYWATDAWFDRNNQEKFPDYPNGAKLTYYGWYRLEGDDTEYANPWFDDFTVREYFGPGDYGIEYSSFCGYYLSDKLGGDTYGGLEAEYYVDKTAEFVAAKGEGVKANIISLLNYIYDQYGSVDQWVVHPGPITEENNTKFAAQLAIWVLLEDGVSEARAYSAIVDGIVDDALANYAGYIGAGAITDIVFLASEEYDGVNGRISCQPQIVPLYGEGTFDNEPEGDWDASFKVIKTVDGDIVFSVWLDGYLKGIGLLAPEVEDFETYDAYQAAMEKYYFGILMAGYNTDDGYPPEVIRDAIEELLADISFKLFKGDDTFIADALLDADGTIFFDWDEDAYPYKSLQPGEYYIVEYLTGKAKDLFINDDGEVILTFTISAAGGVVSDDFDYDAFYTIVNGYGSGSTLGYPGLNNNGDIFYIGVVNVDTGEEYSSFCANAGSQNFAGDNGLGCSGYYTTEAIGETELKDFLNALNTIEDKYGDLEENRAITQTVIWALLGAIDVDSPEFDATNLTEDEKTAVRYVMEKYDDYSGPQKIMDAVFMVCENPDHGFVTCQPQLVPIYGQLEFDNRTPEEFLGSVWFNKVKFGGELLMNEAHEFSFDLFKWNDDTGEYEYLQTEDTDINGTVFVDKLTPGFYMFVEVTKTVFEGGLGFDELGNPAENYNLIWTPVYPGDDDDGLYFVINDKGETEWPDDYLLDEKGAPTVDNVIPCKHNVLWVPDGYVPYFSVGYEVIDLGEGKGMLISFTDSCDGILEIRGTRQPSCEAVGIIWLGCSENCGIGTGIEFGEILEHDFQPVAIAPGYGDGMVWFTCPNGCGGSYVEYDAEEWFRLGGPGFTVVDDEGEEGVLNALDFDIVNEYTVIALAPGYGNGYV